MSVFPVPPPSDAMLHAVLEVFTRHEAGNRDIFSLALLLLCDVSEKSNLSNDMLFTLIASARADYAAFQPDQGVNR